MNWSIASSTDSSIMSIVRRTEMKLSGAVEVGNAALRFPQTRRPVPNALNTVTIPAALRLFVSDDGAKIDALSVNAGPDLPSPCRLDGRPQEPCARAFAAIAPATH